MEAVGFAILASILGACIIFIATSYTVTRYKDKENEALYKKYEHISDKYHELAFEFSLCKIKLREYEEADVQGQVDEMSKIIMNRNRGDFYESREIATALYRKGYRLTEEESNEDKD